MRIAVVVKYYPPVERVSGIIGYLTVLNRHLSDAVDLHVVTSRSRGDQRRSLEHDGHTVHRVGGSFPVSAGRAVRRLRPDAFLFVSGVYDLRVAGPYIEAFNQVVRRPDSGLFLQATHVRGAPNAVFARALRPYRRVLAASAVIGDALRPVVGERLEVFPPAVEIPAAHCPTGPLRVGFANHLNRVKGADVACGLIVDAITERPALEAVVAGTGELDDHVRSRLAGVDRVRFAGFLPEADRLELIRSCGVMLLPFRTAVSVLGVSQTVLEVMAAGNVVVGTDTDAINGAVVHGRTGLLGSVDGLAPLLSEVLDDPACRSRLGAEARRVAARDWNVSTRAQRLLQLLSR
jgi:glycosyltransferase involved in cell wall biosynthesis